MAEYYPQDRIIDEIVITSALRDRRIYFNEEVTRESIFKAVHLLDRLVAIDKKTATKDDIEIILDCYGGVIYSGLSLISKILELQDKGYKINIITNSIAASMGFMFATVGSHRKALRYSTFMCHSPSSGSWGMLQDLEDDIDEVKRLWCILKEIIKSHTNITEEMLEDIKMRRRDWYISAEEALELGVIDEII